MMTNSIIADNIYQVSALHPGTSRTLGHVRQGKLCSDLCCTECCTGCTGYQCGAGMLQPRFHEAFDSGQSAAVVRFLSSSASCQELCNKKSQKAQRVVLVMPVLRPCTNILTAADLTPEGTSDRAGFFQCQCPAAEAVSYGRRTMWHHSRHDVCKTAEEQ